MFREKREREREKVRNGKISCVAAWCEMDIIFFFFFFNGFNLSSSGFGLSKICSSAKGISHSQRPNS